MGTLEFLPQGKCLKFFNSFTVLVLKLPKDKQRNMVPVLMKLVNFYFL